MHRKLATLMISSWLLTGCAELNQLAAVVRAPQFQQSPDHRAEIRMSGAASGLPPGGAGVRL